MWRALAVTSLAVSAGCYAAHGLEDDAGGISSTVTMPCTGTMPGGPRRDCGFRVERVETCVPGRSVTVACGCGGLGTCVGDPVLRICAGTDACRVASALENVDDVCGLCPSATVTCPPAGRLTILTAPYSGGSYTCSVGVR